MCYNEYWFVVQIGQTRSYNKKLKLFSLTKIAIAFLLYTYIYIVHFGSNLNSSVGSAVAPTPESHGIKSNVNTNVLIEQSSIQ